ncbi:MAG: FIST C-terminal domain-containing protein [Clostridiales Family XIII bacterium]|jgi:hypothetical protein|nr:FIST C-terminal domain-containing protein [Clostridiales Family XIII bacterium]
MIKAITVSTSEIDDAEAAVAEITAQLDAGNRLLAHSIGLMGCYSDFIDSGVVAALHDALPFEFVGTTTLGAISRETDPLVGLTMLVLTSDDVSFVTGLTEPIEGEDADVIARGYAEAAKKLGEGEKPSLLLSYAPLLLNVGGDFFVNTLSEVSGQAPNFGTVSADDTIDYHNSHIIINGEAYRDRLAFVLVCGDVKPKFRIASISGEKIFREKGVVTASRGNQLQTINGISVEDYLLSLGLKKGADGTLTGVNSYPFIVDYNDGSPPVVRIIFAITPEGYAVCGGDIPEGATLSVGFIDGDEVVKATGDELRKISPDDKPAALLIFSCIGRYFSLGYESEREADEVKKLLAGTGIPYAMTYSGGEICPTGATEGDAGTINRFHNDTFAICVL